MEEVLIMGFNSNTSAKQIIEYASDNTFKALLTALENSQQFNVKDSNVTAGTISISTGISMKSWGENLLLTISPTSNGFSELSISSMSKFGLADWGKNQDNIHLILTLLHAELAEYNKVTRPSATESDDVVSKLKQLSELKEANIISEAEFEAKKKELLAQF